MGSLHPTRYSNGSNSDDALEKSKPYDFDLEASPIAEDLSQTPTEAETAAPHQPNNTDPEAANTASN